MITEDEILRVGRVTKTHSKFGALILHTTTDAFCESNPTFLVLDIDHIYVPFQIHDWREKNAEDVIVELEYVDSEERAQRLCGKEAFMLRREVNADFDEQMEVEHLIGCQVVDTQRGDLGAIRDIDCSTINILLQLDNELVIPFHEDFVESFDSQHRILTLTLPEGLL